MKKYFWMFFLISLMGAAIGVGLCMLYVGIFILSICIIIGYIISLKTGFLLGLFFYWLFCVGIVTAFIGFSKRLRNAFATAIEHLSNISNR